MTAVTRIGSTTRTRRSARSRLAAGASAVATAGLLLTQLVTSSTAAAAAATSVDLHTAGSYSVLGGQTVTNTGPTSMTGDLGVSPGSAITGFPPGTHGGALHAADAQALQAQADLTTAYNDAAGQAKTASVADDLVGRTLTGGVYKSTGPLALSGTLTLDAQGDPDSVFIFQVASTLITASASHVKVVNGAQACHVFWQVAKSATLGTSSTFIGTIMALASVTVTTDTTVTGRAMARNGAVTLDNDTFVDPACDDSPPDIATTTTLSTPTVPAQTGGTIPLVAKVATAAGAVRTGTVAFTEGNVTLGTSPIASDGTARLPLAAGTAVGNRTVIARYSGHLILMPSTSRPATLRVEVPAARAPTGRTAKATTSAPGAATGTGTGTHTGAGTDTDLATTGQDEVNVMAAGAALIAVGLAFLGMAAPRRRGLHRT